MILITILLVIFNVILASRDQLPRHIMPCGAEVPQIGLGSFNDGKSEQQRVQMWLDGIQAGYRLLDTAYQYENEKHLGLALRQLLEEKKVKREELFVVSKVWNTFHEKEMVIQNIKNELADLGLAYADLSLLHYPTSLQPNYRNLTDYWPTFENGSVKPLYWGKDVGYLKAWRGMEAAHIMGYSRHIGLSNFNQHQIEKVLSVAKIRPVILQTECNPLYQNNQLTEWARDNNLTVMCYSPLGTGRTDLSENNILAEVAEKVGKSTRQVALRWSMQKGNIVIPRTYDKYHQRENFEALDFVITEDEMKKIDEIPQKQKLFTSAHKLPPGLKFHPDYPFDE